MNTREAFDHPKLRRSHLRMLASTLIILAWAAIPLVSQAQESGKTWRISDPSGNSTSYPTQADAVAQIKNLAPLPPEQLYTNEWTLVDTIKDTSIAPNGDVSISYWMGKKEPNDPNFSYASPYTPTINGYPTEQQALNELIQNLNESSPACPLATATPIDDWQNVDFGTEGSVQLRYYSTTFALGNNTPDNPCEVFPGADSLLSRTRRLYCPIPATTWSNEYQACVNEDYVATVTSKPETCPNEGKAAGAFSGMVGNPCSVKTGEKFETEYDLELPWLSFDRFYHSGVSSSSGSFGPGWTHSHQIRLSISANVIGVIEGSGYQTRYSKVGNEFVAADGSNNRIVAEGANWKLSRADNEQIFAANGQLVERRLESGKKLIYGYDAYGRLGTIADANGHSLSIAYNGNDGESSIASLSSAGQALASYTYTSGGQVETVTFAGGASRTYHYEDTRFPRHLTGITDERSVRFSTFAYDAKGRAISSQHAGGVDGVTLVYQPQGGAIVTDALGMETTYGLTATTPSGTPRKVGSVTDPRGTMSQTYYDESVDFRQRVDTTTDRNGTQTKHTYAEGIDPQNGLPVTIHTMQEAVGTPESRTSIEQTALTNNRVVTSRIGNRETRVTRNSRLQPVTVTVRDVVTGDARTTTYAYCEAADVSASNSTCPILGYPKSVDGPRTDVSDVTTYQYYGSDDASCAATPSTCPHRKGDLWKVINAVGHVTQMLAYDAAGRVSSMSDANGTVTDMEYDPRGWPTARKVRGTNNSSEADDRITRMAYTPTGLVEKMTQPDGAFAKFTYDGAQRLTDIEDNAGNTIHYDLDDAGNRLQEDTKDSAGTLKRTLTRVYNELGQLETIANAQDDPTDFKFDADDNPDTVTDAFLRVTDTGYDPLNRLSTMLEDVGGIEANTSFKYNAQDDVTKITDPKGLDTNYVYNAIGDLQSTQSPDTGTTTYTNDSAGNRKTQLDARGKLTTYTYDALNRLTLIRYSDTTPSVSYAYDNASGSNCGGPNGSMLLTDKGWLSSMTDATGVTKYCRDRFGDLKSKTTSASIIYTYSAGAKLTNIKYPDGALVDYVRDTQGRVTEVGVKSPGSVRQVLLRQATYYPFGPVAGWSYGNGRSMVRNYNLNYQPEKMLDASVGGLSLSYVFNEVGNLTQLKDGFQSAVLARYDYDHLNRLSDVKDGPTSTVLEHYGYDDTGNRLSLTSSGGGTIAYTYPTTSHRLTQVGSVARTFDAVGNVESIGGAAKSFVYDGSDRMTQVKLGGTVAATYAYNGRGEQVKRTVGTTTTTSYYDEAGHWLGDYNGSTPLQQVVWLDDLPVGLLVGSGATQTLHYIEPDHLGTPRVVIEQARNAAIWTWDARGEAFGDNVTIEDPDGDNTKLVLSMRFPGQRYDAVSGLNQNYFRDYEAATGRYVQSDPIGLSGGMSTYSYVRSNPILGIDPTGLIGYLCKTGNNIGIAIPINFRGGSDAQVAGIVSSIEKAWTGNLGGYNVKTVVRVYRTDNQPGANAINIWQGTKTSTVDKPNNDTGNWYVPSEWGNDTYPHEAGHLLGLQDEDNTGIMSGNLNGATVNDSNMQKILNPWNQDVLRGCGCD